MKDTKYCHGCDYDILTKAIERSFKMLDNPHKYAEHHATGLRYVERTIKKAQDMGLDSLHDVHLLRIRFRAQMCYYRKLQRESHSERRHVTA